MIANVIITFLSTLVASSGFWVWMMKRAEVKDLRTRLLIGLAHDRIITVALTYIERGWIDRDEYENLKDYLYHPYVEIGGNGTAAKIMAEVDELPIRKHIHKKLPKRRRKTDFPNKHKAVISEDSPLFRDS